MNILRISAVFLAAAYLAAGCGKKASEPAEPPEAAVTQWWRAVAYGDRDTVERRAVPGAVRELSAAQSAEYARIRRSAAAGDELAVRMLKRLDGIRTGEVNSGPERAIVKLVMDDGRPFMTAYLQAREGRWVIVELTR